MFGIVLTDKTLCVGVYGWLELMVHYKPSKAEDESAPVFIHPHMVMVHPLGVVWSVRM